MRIVAIIQARMTSTRLPGKVLKDICGRSMLARVIERARLSRLMHQVVVATSVDASDEPIISECEKLQVATFRGSLADVLDRYYMAARHFQADSIVRITSDCPLLEPQVADQTISAFLEQQPDYASNTLERTFPRGLDTEVMRMTALERAWREARQPYQRAHVTPFLYQNPGLFRLVSVRAEKDYNNYRWTVDTAEDLELVRGIYGRFAPRSDFGWRDVMRLLEQEPALADLNRNVKQKALEQG